MIARPRRQHSGRLDRRPRTVHEQGDGPAAGCPPGGVAHAGTCPDSTTRGRHSAMLRIPHTGSAQPRSADMTNQKEIR